MEFFPESAEARLQRHSGRYNAVRNPSRGYGRQCQFHAEWIYGYRTNRGCSAEPYLPEEPGSRYMESRYRGHILEVDINEKERTVGACTCAEKAIKTGFKQEIYESEQRSSKTRTM